MILDTGIEKYRHSELVEESPRVAHGTAGVVSRAGIPERFCPAGSGFAGGFFASL
jgi:hypothetical protein